MARARSAASSASTGPVGLLQKPGEVLQHRGDVGMLAPKRLLPDREGPPVERLSFRVYRAWTRPMWRNERQATTKAQPGNSALTDASLTARSPSGRIPSAILRVLARPSS